MRNLGHISRCAATTTSRPACQRKKHSGMVFGVLHSLILHPLIVPDAQRIFSVVQKPHGYDSSVLS